MDGQSVDLAALAPLGLVALVLVVIGVVLWPYLSNRNRRRQ